MPAPELEFLLSLARQGAALAREQLGQVSRQLKRGEEAVTEADRAVQRLIVAALTARFPGDGIIGEENDDGSAITNRAPAAGNQRVWVIDPIDGTNNYIAGYGAFAVCIGLLEAGHPTLGIVYDVARDEGYVGAVGLGDTGLSTTGNSAWLVSGQTWRPIRVAGSEQGPQALLMLTSNLLIDRVMPQWALRLLTVTPWKLRMLGSAALECVQVGAGTAHGAITLNGKLWDVAAAAAVVLAAGGRITDFRGNDVFPIDLRGYAGGKVPFLAAAPAALAGFVAELRHDQPVA